MSCNTKDIRLYSKGFNNLQALAFKDIYINGVCLRVMGIHFMDFGSDWSVKRHKHSFYEFHYVTENDVFTTINGMEYNIKAGQFYLMPPGTYHSHRQDPGTGHTGFALRWELINDKRSLLDLSNASAELEKIQHTLSGLPQKPLPDTDCVILESFAGLLELAENGCRLILLQMVFAELVVRIAERLSGGGSEMHAELNRSFLDNHIVDTAAAFLEENYNQDIDVADVSHSVHMSYSHLSRLFKKHTGETISGYLNGIRLKKAQKLLVCTGKSIRQIACEAGFNSEHYFCGAFKKQYGVSPGAYRMSNRKIDE